MVFGSSLAELCLSVIASDTQRALFAGGVKSSLMSSLDEEEKTVSKKRPEKPSSFFVECAPGLETVKNWKDPWAEVREAGEIAARGGEPRPQIASALASFGRLVDGALPSDFWEDLRCDALSLASSRIGPATIASLARAQRAQSSKRLVAVDLGGCLLVDDDSVKLLAEACGSSLERLGLRDCRKLTDGVFDLAINASVLPHLIDVDLGGNVNVTPQGARRKLLQAQTTTTNAPKKARLGDRLQLRGLGLSGIGADADLVSACADGDFAPHLQRIGLGYAKAPSMAFQLAFEHWPSLTDLRVQWTTSFDDTALDALAFYCASLRALDVSHSLFQIIIFLGRRHPRLRRRPQEAPAPPGHFRRRHRRLRQRPRWRRRRLPRRQHSTAPTVAQLPLHGRTQTCPPET